MLSRISTNNSVSSEPNQTGTVRARVTAITGGSLLPCPIMGHDSNPGTCLFHIAFSKDFCAHPPRKMKGRGGRNRIPDACDKLHLRTELPHARHLWQGKDSCFYSQRTWAVGIYAGHFFGSVVAIGSACPCGAWCNCARSKIEFPSASPDAACKSASACN